MYVPHSICLFISAPPGAIRIVSYDAMARDVLQRVVDGLQNQSGLLLRIVVS